MRVRDLRTAHRLQPAHESTTPAKGNGQPAGETAGGVQAPEARLKGPFSANTRESEHATIPYAQAGTADQLSS